MKRRRTSVARTTASLGLSTFLSKVLGLAREIVLARYLGVGPVADAFFTAFRIPNSLRKIFAEGALTAALVPTLVQSERTEGRAGVSRVVTLVLGILQIVLGCVGLCVALYAPYVVTAIVPGWSDNPDQVATAARLVRVLIFFIMGISASSACAAALQTAHHFLVPAWAQIVMNVCFVIQLACAHTYAWSVHTVAWFLLANSCVFFLVHLAVYGYFGFSLKLPTKDSWRSVRSVVAKMVPCFIGVGAIELNLWIDQALASYLPAGSISLLRYTYGFLRIPVGVFGVAFSTILFPMLAKTYERSPRRLPFVFVEAAKMVAWVVLPMSVFFAFFSRAIFATTLAYFSPGFTADHIATAGWLLTLFSSALFFMTFEKIVLNLFYAMHAPRIPTYITLAATVLNCGLNVVGMRYLGLYGIVLATVVSAVVKCVALLAALWYRQGVDLHLVRFFDFLLRYAVHVVVVFTGAAVVYHGCATWIASFTEPYRWMLYATPLYWVWAAPIWGAAAAILYFTRSWVGIRLYFMRAS